mmetsp:Transcript_12385/g.33264  ORF Transcript_12385/g.33264 Transcript_12385/m.33264 type:complete len:222 (+) Transcript_12385:800-1465(+)
MLGDDVVDDAGLFTAGHFQPNLLEPDVLDGGMHRGSVAWGRRAHHRLQHTRLLVVEILEARLALRPASERDVHDARGLELLVDQPQTPGERLGDTCAETCADELPQDVLRALRVPNVHHRHHRTVQASGPQGASVEVGSHLLPQEHLLGDIPSSFGLHQQSLVVALPAVNRVLLREARLAMLGMATVTQRPHVERPRVVEAAHAVEGPNDHRCTLGIHTHS